MGAFQVRFGLGGLLLLLSCFFSRPIIAEERLSGVPTPDNPTPIELGYRFGRITPADGLPHFIVYDFHQDSQGYLWMGTEGGLTRYDGYSFKTYAHDPDDPLSPSSSVVYQIVESTYLDTPYIWFRTPEGMNRLNLFTEQTLRFIPAHDDSTTTRAYAYSCTDGEEGTFWVGTTDGLLRYDYRTGLFEHLLPGIRMEDIYRDSQGIIWIASDNDGLLGYDPETGEVEQYLHDPEDPSSISGNDLVAHIFESDFLGPRYLWVGTDQKDFNLFDKQTHTFQRFDQQPYSLPDNAEPEFESVRFGPPELWLMTYPKGFKVLDLQTGQLAAQRMHPDNPDGLFHNTVLEMFEDNSGIIWIGSFVGLDRLNRFEQVFHNLSHRGLQANRLASDGIMGFCLDSRGRMWLGGKAGVSILDPVTGVIEQLKDNPHCPPELRNDLIIDIEEDMTGNIWISGFTGMYHLDLTRRNVRHYKTDWGGGNDLPVGLVSQFVTAPDGVVWLASSRGIFRYLPETDRFEEYPPLEELVAMLSPRYSNQDLLFVGSRSGGLIAFDRNTGEYMRFLAVEDDPSSLSTNRIYSIYEGRDSILWVATNQGLDYARIVEGVHDSLVFKHYTMADGLPAEAVLSVQEDLQGRLWVGTQNGVAVLDQHQGRFRIYDEGDGIANANCIFNACARDQLGRLYFGTMEELLVFHPDSLRDNPYPPPIVLTDFQLFHEPVPIRKQARGLRDPFSLPRSISYLDTLELSYRENVFTLTFAGLDFRNPLKNKYAYKLAGFEKDWIFTDATRHQVTYMNLSPGRYIFQVRGSNNDGLWNENSRDLHIIITPPWWLSRWAYAGYILLGLLVLTGVWWLELNRIHFRHQLEMDHLRAERYAELDELKSRFFANISHEFRTPLTLILGPIDKWRQRIRDKELKQDLSLMQKHAKRVLGLVTQLLDLSKLEAGKMQLQAAERNVVPLLKGLVLSFASLAERRKITLSFHSDLEEVRAYVDKEALVKIMNNLLSNAFKFTPDGGEINAEVQIQEVSDLGPEGALVIRIVDSGIGIPGDLLENIFDRFTQVNSSASRIQEGTGIGLALTKELVEMHQGRISVESHAGEGSVFRVDLPLGMTHLDADEIVEHGDDAESVSFESAGVESVVHRAEPPGVGRAKPLILIVEDNTDVRRYIRSYLDRDYRCLEAVDGQDGLDQVINQTPDLIISDIMMPEMDGVELCQRIKGDERTSHIPIVLLTAKADLNNKLEGLEMGADAYLTKPFEADELLTRVRNLIVQRQKLREHFQKELHIIPADMALSSMDTQLVEKVLKAVFDRIDDPDFKVTNLARAVHMSAQHLNRKLHALSGLTTQDFIRSIRLKQAALQLRSASGTVTEIAYRVGFRSSSHFARAFHMEYGQSPTDYLKQHTR
jgi:signal transduction histidine kinase/CheY-like chemotaxis protein/ligand-binding sensor domain-containing protein